MIDHDTVVFLPVETIKQMKADGHRSFNIKMLNDSKYNIIKIPSIKKRVFLESDYSVLQSMSINSENKIEGEK